MKKIFGIVLGALSVLTLASCGNDVIVINEDNEYVGYCGVWIEERNKLCYLEPLCVISSYRNKGVGKAIIAEVIRKTKDISLSIIKE